MSNIFVPKSNEEILNLLKNEKDNEKIFNYGLQFNNEDLLKKAIDNGYKIDNDVLYDMDDQNEHPNIRNYYIEKLKESNHILDKVHYVIALIILQKNINIVFEALSSIKDLSTDLYRNTTYAYAIMHSSIKYRNFSFIKKIYNYPGIKNNIPYEQKDYLANFLISTTENEDVLDLILNNNLVNESIEDVLKAKSKQEINDIQNYLLVVIIELDKLYNGNSIIYYIINNNKPLIKQNKDKHKTPKETAIFLYDKYKNNS